MIPRLVGALAWVLVALAGAPVEAAGLQSATLQDIAGKPLRLSIWYPSAARPTPQSFGPFHPNVAIDGAPSGRRLPLIVISHGNGGSALSHYDTAIALADAGFVVVTFDHPGDNFQDQSRAGFRRDLIDRPRQVKAVVDYMLEAWPHRDLVDAGRVGMFGFSLGGFTTLVSIGGTPDIHRIIKLCADYPRAPDCAFVRDHHGDQLDSAPFPAPVWVHDPRIKAAVIAAPAASYTFGPGSLDSVRAPVQLWIADDDAMAPARWNSDLVRRELPHPPESRRVAGAGHLAFLTPEACSQAPASGCAKFHIQFNASVVEFFEKTLTASSH
jgi:predicted dienelactone hydrolase